MDNKLVIVDSHCHLNFPDFANDLPEIIARAHDSGVAVMQTICTKMEEFARVQEIALANENIYCSVGVHPCNVSAENMVTINDLLAAAQNSKTIAIGETGLDYHYGDENKTAQQNSFRLHIAAAREARVPVIVHSRDADKDTIDILREEMQNGEFKFLIHCFTAGRWLADAAIDIGGYISFSGIVTFKNAKPIQEIAAILPQDRILVETDAPYLAPVPHRGKRNEPAFTYHVCEYLAKLRDSDIASMARATSDNFFTLFTKATKIDY